MVEGLILLVLGLAILTSYMVWHIIDRVAGDERVAGQTLDAESIRPRIDKVRHDYVAEVRSRERDSSFHDELMAMARRKVAEFAFFQSHPSTAPNDEHVHAAH